MKIAYVCTNYNNSDFSTAAVDSLMRNTNHDIVTFVVDNASRIDEVKKLDALPVRHASCHVIKSGENVGYFRGLNIGLRSLSAIEPDTRWVIVGNNDLEFPDDICDRLESNAANLGKHMVVSPDIVTLDGEHQNPHVISGISPVREIFYDLYYSSYYFGSFIYKLARMFPRLSERPDELEWRVARSIYQGHGSCYILTPKFFDRFRELWAPTFMMSEEYFLSKQLGDCGESIYYDPCVRVTHHWHGALDSIPGRRRWAMARDAHREYRKYIRVRPWSRRDTRGNAKSSDEKSV